jgi:class 3 adenylate cyclase
MNSQTEKSNMASEQGERKLAAILAADVVGYSRLSGADEEGTIRRLQALRNELIEPAVEAGRGRIFKTMGDGFLIEFASVVDAVRAFVQVQRDMRARNAQLSQEQRLELRVGIHVGDVMMQPDGDLLGNGVNLAARLEAIAEPGGISLSEDAYRQVRDLDEEFIDLGDRKLKNITRPMRVYAVQMDAAGGKQAGEVSGETVETRVGDNASRRSPAAASRGAGSHANRAEPMKLPAPVRVRGPGLRLEIKTVTQAVKLIDRNLPPELASLPRWTFARALLLEAMRTGKSRDLNAAARQLAQALRNERWLDEHAQPRSAARAKSSRGR